MYVEYIAPVDLLSLLDALDTAEKRADEAERANTASIKLAQAYQSRLASQAERLVAAERLAEAIDKMQAGFAVGLFVGYEEALIALAAFRSSVSEEPTR